MIAVEASFGRQNADALGFSCIRGGQRSLATFQAGLQCQGGQLAFYINCMGIDDGSRDALQTVGTGIDGDVACIYGTADQHTIDAALYRE